MKKLEIDGVVYYIGKSAKENYSKLCQVVQYGFI